MYRKIVFTFIIILISHSFVISNTGQIPRPEHPKPHFKRALWKNLNGTWTYEFDFGKSGNARELYKTQGFDNTIIVPFCPESVLSGVGYKDFIESMWYHREFVIPDAWSSKRCILHFGGVDYQSEIFVNGKSVGVHFGGTSSFHYYLGDEYEAGDTVDLVVHVLDETRSGNQPIGKQSQSYHSHGCHYTRTTGIWQTVWLEAVPKQNIASCNIIPDLDNQKFIFVPTFQGTNGSQTFRVEVLEDEQIVAFGESKASNSTSLEIKIDNPHLWSPDSPFLYEIVFMLKEGGNIIDSVESYAGMRKIHTEQGKFYLNNKPVFLRFVLDQGFYPDGVWTAPTDSALKKDIQLSKKAGFNGARLHQKVFEQRFHYWADKLGYLTWAESSSWGLDVNNPLSARNFISEWEEIVCQSRNHPSIIAWTPFNETAGRRKSDGVQHNRLITDVYDLTKNLDPTRPINDVSGYFHVKTDIWSVHCYDQDPEKLYKKLTPAENGEFHNNGGEMDVDYDGEPYVVDEFGGIKWISSKEFNKKSWGYGNAPKTVDEFYGRLKSLTTVLLEMPHVAGYCYTQLTDVEQEQNGIYNFNRTKKFNMKKIHSIFSNTKYKE